MTTAAPVATAADELAVNEVFGPTIQGEGPTAGRRAGFVRLARCNLSCSWCDTPYTWDWSRYDPAREIHRRRPAELLERIEAMGVDRVVVTGGEPLLQQRRLVPLLEGCRARGWAVEIETNGTRVPLAAVVAPGTQLNVSIKLANSGLAEARRIRPTAIRALAGCGQAIFKFVVAAPADLDEVAALADRLGLQPVWITPEGTTPEAILAATRELADAVVARGWHMGTRLHVLAWGNERGR